MHATAGETHSDGTKFNKVGLGPKCKKACLKILSKSMNASMQQQQTLKRGGGGGGGEKKREKKRKKEKKEEREGRSKSEKYEKKIV